MNFDDIRTITVITVERVTGPITGAVHWYAYKGEDKKWAHRFNTEQDAIDTAERWHFEANGEAVVILMD